MSIKEILEEVPKLTRKERQQLRVRLDSEDFPETDELLAAVEVGFHSMETGSMVTLDKARETVRKWATKSK